MAQHVKVKVVYKNLLSVRIEKEVRRRKTLRCGLRQNVKDNVTSDVILVLDIQITPKAFLLKTHNHHLREKQQVSSHSTGW